MILNGLENIFPACHLQIYIFYSKRKYVVLLSRLYMYCAPFLLFEYIRIENGMIGFTSLCCLLVRFKVLFQARIEITRPEYCRKLIVTLYFAFSSSYV